MGSKFTFAEMQEIVKCARDRLKEISDKGEEICSRFGGYVPEIVAYHESTKEEYTELHRRIDHYEPLIGKAIEEDMLE